MRRLLAPAGAVACFALGATAPAQAADVIAVAGDIACDPGSTYFNGGFGDSANCRQKYTSDLLTSQRASVQGLAGVLAIGDTQYEDGALAKFGVSYDPSWGRVKDITYPAVGNHEYYIAGAAGYFDYFNGPGNFTGPAGDRDKGYYSSDVGGWHIITLNSNCAQVGGCGSGSAQEQWLRADLAAHPTSCTLAQMHEPFYNSGPSGIYWEMQDFWKTLYNAGAEVVVGGHAHTYEQFKPQDAYENLDLAYGMRQFIVGTGGKNLGSGFNTLHKNSELRDNSHFGVLKLTRSAIENSYDWAFVNESGATVYSGTQFCHGAPPAADTTPPETTIDSWTVTRDRATFAFSANEPATFTCQLDGGTLESCSSPKTYTGLARGSHTFAVYAIDTAGNADPTPATRPFRIKAGGKAAGS